MLVGCLLTFRLHFGLRRRVHWLLLDDVAHLDVDASCEELVADDLAHERLAIDIGSVRVVEENEVLLRDDGSDERAVERLVEEDLLDLVVAVLKASVKSVNG